MRIELTARGVIYVALVIAAVLLLRRLWPVVLLVLTALIFMGALLPYVEWLVARKVPRGIAVFLVSFAVFAGTVGLFAMTVPGLIDELDHIRDELPRWAEEIELWLADLGIQVDLEERARDINWEGLLSGRAVDYGQQVLLTLFGLFTILVMTVYLLIDAPRLAQFIYRLVPPDREDDAARVMRSMTRVVGGYVRGQFITSLIIGVYTFVVLTAVGVPNALAFAVLAGIADIIPLIGAYLAVGPQVLAASDLSMTHAIVVLVALVLYQQFEDRILVPRVYGATMNLPPLVVLITVLIGAELLGIAGVLLSLPAAAAGRVVLDYMLERRMLGLPLPGTDEGGHVFAPDMEHSPGSSSGASRGDDPPSEEAAPAG